MKTILYGIIVCLVSIVCNSANAQSDESAIKAVIDGETAASNAADYKAYKSYWAHVPYASFLIFGEQYVGDAFWKQNDKIWANRKPGKDKVTRTNWNLHTKGDAAFVTFNQRRENPEKGSVSETAEARYLEKIEGTWKIVNVTVVQKPSK